MKKLITAALAAAMVLALTACQSQPTGTTKAPETTAQATEAQETAGVTEQSEEETSEKILVMATNAEFPPYEYHEGDEIVGIDAEIAAAIAEDLGMTLEIEDMAFDSLIAAVQAGKADLVLAGMTVTEDRLMNVNFSESYAQAKQVIIVKEESEIAGITDLDGKTVGVQLGTTGDILADDIADGTIERYNKGFEAIQSLLQDKIDAVVIDNEPAKVFVSENAGLKIIEDAYEVEEYAAAIAKDNTELLDKVNASLAKLKESGKLQEIIDKYISAE